MSVAERRDPAREAFAEWQAELAHALRPGARLLELGCGDGSPELQRLASRFQVSGVDVDPGRVERAREPVPEAEFVCADVVDLELPEQSFDAVVARSVLDRIPNEELAPLLARIHGWLAPGGLLLAALGQTEGEDWDGDCPDRPALYASPSPEKVSRLVREAGFAAVRDELVTFEEPEGPVAFQWVLAQA